MSDVVAPENDLTTTLLDAEIFHPRTFCTMLSPQITVTGFLSALVEWCSLDEVSSDGLGELLFATADFVGWRADFDDLEFFCVHVRLHVFLLFIAENGENLISAHLE